MKYWEECIREALEDAGINATDEQIGTVAYWVEGAHENYGMAGGHDAIQNPLQGENEHLKRELAKERDKSICPQCKGTGREKMNGPVHSSESECWKCRGVGWV